MFSFDYDHPAKVVKSSSKLARRLIKIVVGVWGKVENVMRDNLELFKRSKLSIIIIKQKRHDLD